MAFRWWVSVASRTPTASASSRWLDTCRVFRFSRTSQAGSEPPASDRASSKARLTVRAARASSSPMGVRAGRIRAA